jgi:hypothetical protein
MKAFKIIAVTAIMLTPFSQSVTAKTNSNPQLIPLAYWGEWRNKLAVCGTDNDSILTISEKSIASYEEGGTVTKVIPLKAGGIKVYSNWTDPHVDGAKPEVHVTRYLLSRSGQRLYDFEDGRNISKGYWLRCSAVKKH